MGVREVAEVVDSEESSSESSLQKMAVEQKEKEEKERREKEREEKNEKTVNEKKKKRKEKDMRQTSSTDSFSSAVKASTQWIQRGKRQKKEKNQGSSNEPRVISQVPVVRDSAFMGKLDTYLAKFEKLIKEELDHEIIKVKERLDRSSHNELMSEGLVLFEMRPQIEGYHVLTDEYIVRFFPTKTKLLPYHRFSQVTQKKNKNS